MRWLTRSNGIARATTTNAETVLTAQQVTLTRVAFFFAKAKFYDQFRNRLNDRQTKVIERISREGPDGFKCGCSAENYIAITGTSRATATRDLQDLVEMSALSRTGERRYTVLVAERLCGQQGSSTFGI